MISCSHSRRSPGFTLLELVLAMLLLTLIVGMVFGTAKSSLQLGNAVVETQNEEMLHQAFFDFMGKRLSSLPGNTRFNLKVSDSGSHYLSDLTLQDAPMNFDWGGQTRTAKAVQLSTVKRRSGFLDIVLRYYQNDVLGDTAQTTALDNKPFAEIILLENVRLFEWRVMDGRSTEWTYDWDVEGRMPLQMELTIAFGAQGEQLTHIFWLPPKTDPEIFFRQMVQTASREANSGGDGGNGNGDGNERPPHPNGGNLGEKETSIRPEP